MAATTPNMGLKVWNLLTDSFDHTQQAENWAKVDQHNHAEGKGIKIPTGGIEDGAISLSKMGAESINGEKITALLGAEAGISTPTRTYRKYVTSSETYSNATTSYTAIDVATIYVPAGSMLRFSYVAGHKATTSNATLTTFVDGNEIKSPVAGGLATVAVATSEVSTFYGPLNTSTGTLVATKGTAEFNTTNLGTWVGLPVSVYGLAAGNHTVEIKAKAGAAGTIQVKERNLWAWVEAFNA